MNKSIYGQWVQAKKDAIFLGRTKWISMALLFIFSFANAGLAQHSPSRIVDLKIVADVQFRQNQEWNLRAKRLVEASSKKFERCFGIKLNIKTVRLWFPNEGCVYLTDLFEDLTKRVKKSDCDVVLGLTSHCYQDGDYFGLASYDQGYILIRTLSSEPLMKFTLVHELCHLFGALDRSSGDTFMNRDELGSASSFDGLTSELILLNKFRGFEINLSPISSRKLKDIISLYSHIQELNQGEADINMLLASLFLENCDYESALRECRAVQRIDPDYPGINSIMGRAYLMSGETEEAIEELKAACKSLPGDYQAHSNLASAYLKSGNIDKAAKECRTTIKINPGDANAYSCLGFTWLAKQKLKEAKEACQKAISLDPGLPEPHNLMGILFEKEDRIEEAKKEYLKSLELNPDCYQVHVNLGIMYFKRNSLAESAHHYRKAIEINPDFADAYNTLAVISFFREQYELAWEYLKKAENLGFEISPKFRRDLIKKSTKK